MSGAPMPAPAAALTLWDHLFASQRGYLCVVLGRRAAGRLTAVRERYFRWPAEAHHAAHAALTAAQAGDEAYFCVHLLAARRRRKDAALPVSALWCELDGPSGAEWPDAVPLPTARVESSPRKYHFYWRLTRPIAPAEAERLNRALAQALGGDPSGADVTQLLRVPGTVNHKYGDRPPVRLVALDPEAAIDPEALALPLGTQAAAADSRRTAAPPLPERLVEGCRNVWLTSLAGSLRRRGLDHDEILAVLRLLNQRRCAPPLAKDELAEIAHSIVRYPAGPTGVPRVITVEVL